MPLGIASAASQNELGRCILRLLWAPSISTGMRLAVLPAHVISCLPISDLEDRDEPWLNGIIDVFFDKDLVEPVIRHLCSVDPSSGIIDAPLNVSARSSASKQARNLPFLTIALHPVPPFPPICVTSIRL